MQYHNITRGAFLRLFSQAELESVSGHPCQEFFFCIVPLQSSDERYVTIRIANTGDGISPEHLPHLFERFYKVDRSRHDQGIGLGLSIVKHIVLAHGGQVYVDSELGGGSTFSFTLPRAS